MGTTGRSRGSECRAHAAIRNRAAYGEFDQISQADVRGMIEGVRNFLAEAFYD